ncbi:MAG: class I SAM-dependent methyltransferase [Actinomycetota bacterium]
MIDWSDGDYTRTAAVLAPVADLVLNTMGVGPGDFVLDVGCGTGNVTLAAAQRGATAIGVDPAEGLLAIARERASAFSLQHQGSPSQTSMSRTRITAPTFQAGFADALPFDSDTGDRVISVFGVIFAPDASAAAREMVRVTKPGGVIGLTSWLPGGGVDAIGQLLRAALATSTGTTTPTRWSEPDWAIEVMAEAGAQDLSWREHRLAFTGASPQEWFAEQETHHPLWRAAQRWLSADEFVQFRTDSIALLHQHNEAPDGFSTTSRYAVILGHK